MYNYCQESNKNLKVIKVIKHFLQKSRGSRDDEAIKSTKTRIDDEARKFCVVKSLRMLHFTCIPFWKNYCGLHS